MRTSVLTVLATLVLGVLIGCGSHPAFTGTLNENPGGGPTPPPGAPNVTSLNPSSVIAGGPAFTITVGGVNFAPGDSVAWNNVNLPSTYISATEMQAQVPASDLTRPDSAFVDVVTPTPASLQFGGTFMITIPPLTGNGSFSVSSLAVQANDMVWDPVSQQFYLSVVAGNSTNGSTITTLNPSTGQLGISSIAGSEPDRLSVAGDGSYLYAGMDGSGSVQRFTLPGLATDISIPLGTYTSYLTPVPYYAMDVEVDPANPHTIAVARGVASISPREQGGVVLYDDAVQRPSIIPSNTSTTITPIDFLAWNTAGSDIYGTGVYYGEISMFSVDSTGLKVAATYPSQGPEGVLHYDASTGYLYADSGQVIDPTTGNLIGSFPFSTLQGGFGDCVMVPDDTLHIAYFIGQTEDYSGSQQYAIVAFDLTNFNLLGAVSIPNVIGTPVKLLRWGPNGLAFLTSIALGRPAPGDGVYFVQGGFVTSPAVRNNGIALDKGYPSAANYR